MLVYYRIFWHIIQIVFRDVVVKDVGVRYMGATAYVDGSYNVKTGAFSYGIVFFTGAVDSAGNRQELHYSKAFTHPELSEMRNVAGEIMGAAQAMKIAGLLKIPELTIYHDYEGIAKWCTGEWKTKKPWTRKYRDFYQEMSQTVHITFIKVKGHSGDRYNEIADALARKAVVN